MQPGMISENSIRKCQENDFDAMLPYFSDDISKSGIFLYFVLYYIFVYN